ncbi:unnamed protein product [Ambrosiozyma monospora]|uniref:Unnamed protein product n=1 Tax=Ambrosiozyma monospora TaxID=43982 RepID=A0A9W7DCG6_AMBMO|nr:unnamed protein product [Ambrosiozyma monospora]
MNKSALRANLLNEGGYPPLPGSSKKQRPRAGNAPGLGPGANNNMNMNNNNNNNMNMGMNMQQQQQRPHSASSQHRQVPGGPRGPGGPGAAYNQRPMNQGGPPQNRQNRPFPPNQGMMNVPPQQQQVSQPHGFITHPLQQTDIYDQQQQQQQQPPPPQNYPQYNNQQQQYGQVPPQQQQQPPQGYYNGNGGPGQQAQQQNDYRNGYPNYQQSPNNDMISSQGQQQRPPYPQQSQPNIPQQQQFQNQQQSQSQNSYNNSGYQNQQQNYPPQNQNIGDGNQYPSNYQLPNNPNMCKSPERSQQHMNSPPQNQSYNSQFQPNNSYVNQPDGRSGSYSSPQEATNMQASSNSFANSAPQSRILSEESKQSTVAPNENDRINYLEEKILLLEKALASQDLSPSSHTSSFSDTQPSVPAHQPVQTQSPPSPPSPADITPHPFKNRENTSTFQRSDASAPPLPPPPSSYQKKPLSPLASSFYAKTGNPIVDEIKRTSKSSLVPTPDPTIEDLINYDDDGGFDELPPSYEELEQSGSLTYSKSIYRTGVEKAGLLSDYVNPASSEPPVLESSTTTNEFSSSGHKPLRRRMPPPLTGLSETEPPPSLSYSQRLGSSTSSNYTEPDIPLASANNSVDPSQYNFKIEAGYSSTSASASTSTIPLPTRARTPNPEQRAHPTATHHHQTNQRMHTEESAFEPPSMGDRRTDSNRSNNDYRKPPKSSSTLNSAKLKSNSLSYKVIANGVIEPVLPSKSDEPLEDAIARFKATREQALKDYKKFTPVIQFNWALILLESLARTELVSRMDISGKKRRRPIPFKMLTEQRKTFLKTSVKVLQNLVQLAPNKTRARTYLGDIYAGGIHPGLVVQDEHKGYELFYEAAIQENDALACYRVACCLESGFGCSKNIKKSNQFLERAATLGDPSAMCQLAMSHFTGVNGIQLDMGMSIEWNTRAVESLRNINVMGSDPLLSSRSFSDSRRALYILGKMHQTDIGLLCLKDNTTKNKFRLDQLVKLDVFRNYHKALGYFTEAAKIGHIESQATLGFLYSKGYFPTDNFKPDKDSTAGRNPKGILDARKSVYWFSKAAQEDHVYAALGLANWYGSGAEGLLEKSEQQAFLWGRKAADEGLLPEAEFMIGICFEQGFGVAENRQMAINYFKRSASKGYHKAAAKLKSIQQQQQGQHGGHHGR